LLIEIRSDENTEVQSVDKGKGKEIIEVEAIEEEAQLDKRISMYKFT
jgi:hypothetical protein